MLSCCSFLFHLWCPRESLLQGTPIPGPSLTVFNTPRLYSHHPLEIRFSDTHFWTSMCFSWLNPLDPYVDPITDNFLNKWKVHLPNISQWRELLYSVSDEWYEIIRELENYELKGTLIYLWRSHSLKLKFPDLWLCLHRGKIVKWRLADYSFN